MPPIMSKPSRAAHMAIAFVTIGALVMVNTAIYYLYVRSHPPQPDSVLYWIASIFFSGLTLFVIGFGLGSIGRAGRAAELPPEVAPGEKTAQPAVTAPPMTASPNGQPVMPGAVAFPGQPVVSMQPGAAIPPVAPTAPAARVR